MLSNGYLLDGDRGAIRTGPLVSLGQETLPERHDVTPDCLTYD
jgi:hypothetical protein